MTKIMTTKTMPETVWALVIENEYSTEVSLHCTEEQGKDAQYAYVQEWWGQDIGEDTSMPTDRDEAIREYYERAQGESYTLVESRLPNAA